MNQRQQQINLARAKIDVRHGRVRSVGTGFTYSTAELGTISLDGGLTFEPAPYLRPFLERAERELDAAIRWRPPVIREFRFRRHTP